LKESQLISLLVRGIFDFINYARPANPVSAE